MIFLTPSNLKFGSEYIINATAAIPTGTFTKKTPLHPKLSVITPPKIGPRTSASPNTAASIPIYLALSRGEKISPTTINGREIKIPPPIP